MEIIKEYVKLIVTDGNRRMTTNEDGISYVGVLPFLLDPSIVEGLK